jgi:hypothetical protein
MTMFLGQPNRPGEHSGGVIDTGMKDHPDLARRWIGGYDFIADVATANDENGLDGDPHDPDASGPIGTARPADGVGLRARPAA